MKPLHPLALTLLGVLAMTGCGQKTEGGKTLATVDGETITEKDFEMYQQMRQTRQAPIADKAKEKEVVLNELIDRLLLTRRARDLKLDQQPENRILLKRVEENILAQALIKKTVQETPIADDDLKKRFATELENLHKTEYKVSHILVEDENQAKDIIAQLKRGANFAQLAKQKSIDKESGKNGGDLGWVRQDMVVPEFFSAVTALKKGANSETPAKSEYGFHIVRLHDSRPLQVPTVDQLMGNPRAKEDMARRLRDERIQALVKELRDKAKIKVE
jgi:peptidyl-prolyl cis-trans isomerase C